MTSEQAGLRNCIKERVLAEWIDTETRETCTLGSLSLVNKESTFTMTCGLDEAREQAAVQFSLSIKIRLGGQARSRRIYFNLPSDAAPTMQFDVCRIQDVGTVAAAAHDAGLSDSGFITRASFALQSPGRLIMPNAKVRSDNAVSGRLIEAITSLSRTFRFVVYMRPSDYAREGLRALAEVLGRHGSNQDRPGATNKAIDLTKQGTTPPPPQYEAPQVLIPRSPDEQVAALSDKDDASFVPDSTKHTSFQSVEANIDMARRSTQVSKPCLVPEIGIWMAKAVAVNSVVYDDERIRPFLIEMGRQARAADSAAFYDARAHCSATFFLCPNPEGMEEFLNSARAVEYQQDIRRLVAWVLKMESVADVSLWDDFLRLGRAARRDDHKEYNDRKGSLIGWAVFILNPTETIASGLQES